MAEDADVSGKRTTTRRLCAGTFLDREFRQRLLCDIYNARERRAAPSYGFDLTQVMRYAWRAWWLELVRDAVVIALFIAVVLRVPLAALLTVGLLATWQVLRASWHVLVEWVRLLRNWESYDHVRGLRFRAKLAASGLLGSALVVGGTMIAMHLNPQGSRLRGDLVQTGVLVAVWGLLFAIAGIIRQWQLDRLHHPSAVEGGVRSRRLRTLAEQQDHPITIYSGFRPFVGSGLEVRRWSFAQRLVHKREIGRDRDKEFPRPPFTTSEIVRDLKRSIEDLASTSHSETKLPGLKVRDHVFVEGTYVNEIPGALSDSPPSTILDDIVAKPREEARYHIACQVKAWDGELVTTVFVHVSLQGRTLYIEFSTYALTPTPPRFRTIDEVGGTGHKAALRMALRGLSELPDVLHAPRRLAAAPKHLVNAYRAQWDITAEIGKRRDIGARISAREIASDSIDNDPDEVPPPRRSRRGRDETSYFQFLDVARHSKIIERRLLAAVEEFLKNCGVDTSEFAQRAEAILNNGVLNTGSGTINVNDSAVGYNPSVGGEVPAG